MDRELAGMLIADGNFISFCNAVDQMERCGRTVGAPFDTALMLYGAGVSLLKGEGDLGIVHDAVAEFLEPGRVPEAVCFYDYMVSVLGIV